MEAGERAIGQLERLADVMSGEVTHIHAVGVATLTIRAKSFLFSPQHHFLHCRSHPRRGSRLGGQYRSTTYVLHDIS